VSSRALNHSRTAFPLPHYGGNRQDGKNSSMWSGIALIEDNLAS